MDQDQITAILNGIRFSNAENGFLIGDFQSGKEKVNALGTLLNPEIGLTYKLFGKWIDDDKWGKQFKIRTYEVILPQTTDGIYRYIVRTAKWVGPKIARLLIEKYAEKTLDMLKSSPERVADEIKGVTLIRAKEIQRTIRENAEIEETVVKLEELIGGMGLRQSLPTDLVVKYGADAVRMLEEDPYMLTDMNGIGFPSADVIAVNRFKIDKQSEKRLKAAIRHILQVNAVDGNVWIGYSRLINNFSELLDVQMENEVGLLLKQMEEQRMIEIDGAYIASKYMAVEESNLAVKIKELMWGDI